MVVAVIMFTSGMYTWLMMLFAVSQTRIMRICSCGRKMEVMLTRIKKLRAVRLDGATSPVRFLKKLIFSTQRYGCKKTTEKSKSC